MRQRIISALTAALLMTVSVASALADSLNISNNISKIFVKGTSVTVKLVKTTGTAYAEYTGDIRHNEDGNSLTFHQETQNNSTEISENTIGIVNDNGNVTISVNGTGGINVSTNGTLNFYDNDSGSTTFTDGEKTYSITNGISVKNGDGEWREADVEELESLKSEITLHLPAEVYEQLKVDTVSGSISVDEVSAVDLDIETISGDVDLTTVGTYDTNVRTVSGNIDANNIGAHNINLDTTSGDISLGSINAERVRLSSTSGDVYVDTTGDYSVDTSRVRSTSSVYGNDEYSDNSITISTGGSSEVVIKSR